MTLLLQKAKPARTEWLALLLAQAVWWLAILTGAGFAAALLLLQAGLWWHAGRGRAPQWRIVLLITLSGLLFDAITVAAGLMQFRDPALFGVPLWLVVLWLSFALTVPTLFQLIPGHCPRTLLFAGAGPLAYVGGAALGAAQIHNPSIYTLLLISGWLLLPMAWWWFANSRFAH